MRVIVGGVGYRNLRDHSFGVLLSDRLAARDWPSHIEVEDISYNPIALVQRLQDEPADRRFGLAIVAGAVERARPAGTLAVYRWDNALPDATGIQSAVADAVTGVISLDNTLIVARHFDALPSLVIVIELEPEVHAFGDEITASAARALDRAAAIVEDLALDPVRTASLPEAPLGGGAPRIPLTTRGSDVTIRIN